MKKGLYKPLFFDLWHLIPIGLAFSLDPIRTNWYSINVLVGG
jgi:hypothetical protein